MNEKEDKKSIALQRTASLLVTALLIMSVVLCLFVTVQVMSDGYVNICGFMTFRVVTGSMEPTISVGALMLTRETDISEIEKNDIVCFRSQDSMIWGSIVTHRVVNIHELEDGSILLETKGDANTVADGYYVKESNLVGKVIWYTGDDSTLASIFSFFTSEVGFLACIVFPGLLLMGLIFKDSVGNIRAELDQLLQEAEAREAKERAADPLNGMNQDEYDEMYKRIRAELMEELMHVAEDTEEK